MRTSTSIQTQTQTHINTNTNTQEIVMAEQRNKVISKLHGILRPFVLRRLKADVQVCVCVCACVFVCVRVYVCERVCPLKMDIICLRHRVLDSVYSNVWDCFTPDVQICLQGKYDHVLKRMHLEVWVDALPLNPLNHSIHPIHPNHSIHSILSITQSTQSTQSTQITQSTQSFP